MDILTFSKSVPDCRDEKNRLYDASELVFISLVAVLCGVPSHDTLNRFFSVLDVSWFERAFRDWVSDICEQISGVVAIDGKAVCRNPSASSNSMKNRLYMVSAWSEANGLCLGQEKVNAKSNEITAIPRLIDALDLRGCIVTIDAIGCQKSIANAIVKAGADYVLCVKEKSWDKKVGIASKRKFCGWNEETRDIVLG